MRGWVIGWKPGGCEPDSDVVGITGVGYEMGNHIPLDVIALSIGFSWVIVLVVIGLGGRFWWVESLFWGDKVVGEGKGGIWGLFIESALLILGAERFSVFIGSIVLIALITDVKLGVLFCLFAIF